jgi:hypothetical protein
MDLLIKFQHNCAGKQGEATSRNGCQYPFHPVVRRFWVNGVPVNKICSFIFQTWKKNKVDE